MKPRALVVDDEKLIRDFLTRLLTIRGLDVSTAEDGYKAVEAVSAGPFDIYFVDVRMPGMNGLDVFRAIRAVDPLARVMMMTGYAVEDVLVAAQQEGALGPLRKPFEIEQLDAVIAGLRKD